MAGDIAVRMDEKGRVTLPRSVREALHAEPGDMFYVRLENNGALIVKGENPFVDAWAIIDRREPEDVPMSSEELRQWNSEDGCVSGREGKEEFGLSVDLP